MAVESLDLDGLKGLEEAVANCIATYRAQREPTEQLVRNPKIVKGKGRPKQKRLKSFVEKIRHASKGKVAKEKSVKIAKSTNVPKKANKKSTK